MGGIKLLVLLRQKSELKLCTDIVKIYKTEIMDNFHRPTVIGSACGFPKSGDDGSRDNGSGVIGSGVGASRNIGSGVTVASRVSFLSCSRLRRFSILCMACSVNCCLNMRSTTSFFLVRLSPILMRMPAVMLHVIEQQRMTVVKASGRW